MSNMIKCPECGAEFRLDNAAYMEIVAQVRGEQFDAEVKTQVEAARKMMESEQAAALLNAEKKFGETVAQKDQEIARLNEQAKGADALKERAVNEAVLKKDREIGDLKLGFEQEKRQVENAARDREEKLKQDMAEKDAEIARLRDYRMSRPTKMIGESLEQYCKQEFDSYRMMAFRNAYFEKDNDSREGSKADYVYREEAEDGTPLLSITFEMKNEMDATKTKHKNEEFLKKLDDDRKKNRTEFAVLVTMLEQENEFYNRGIVAAYQYPKMYIVRPQFFIQLITLLRDMALSNLEVKREVAVARMQNLDVETFADNMLDFKEKFGKNVRLAGESFQKAIDKIDDSIRQMEMVKEALKKTQYNLEQADKKAQDLSIKKLTKNSPSVRQKFIDAGVDVK